MRLRLTSVLLLLTTSCAAPHSNGAVWAQQNLDAERVMFQLGDAQRTQQATDFQLSLVDEGLASERQRIDAALQTCPGPAQQLHLSPSDKQRDGMRIHAQNDPTRMAQLADVALSDWYLRRASATGNADFCSRAADALKGSPPTAPSDLLAQLPVDTVARDASRTGSTAQPADQPLIALSDYALGYVDVVQAAAPLPHYLAATYGGVLADASDVADSETAQAMVDAQAPGYPQWEPDALYVALRGGSMP